MTTRPKFAPQKFKRITREDFDEVRAIGAQVEREILELRENEIQNLLTRVERLERKLDRHLEREF